MTVGRQYGHDITDTGVIEKHGMGEFIHESPERLAEHGIDPALFDGPQQARLHRP